MAAGSLQAARLAFKRAFLAYYVELGSPAVTDPTGVFAASYAYLSRLHSQLGDREFMRRLDDETTQLAGQIEQELRQRFRDRVPEPSCGDLEDRLRECLEHGLSRLRGTDAGISVE